MFRHESTANPAPLGHYDRLKDMGDCCTVAGDLGQAQHHYSQAIECQPERAEAYVGLGAVALAQARPRDAKRHFQLAVALNARCPEAYAGLALIYHDEQDYRAAFDMYLRCLDLNGDHLLALLGLFQVSCQMGTFEQIIRYLKLYLQHHGDDVAVLFCLATLHARGGALKAAREVALRVLALDPAHSEAIALLHRIQHAILQGFSQNPPQNPSHGLSQESAQVFSPGRNPAPEPA
ncbi:MAG: tetratricopeptide repeat protein [Planctomycetota bacterium]|nr:tetratricopeptide repeat protein [Planctomycetota bacterium]